MSEITEYYGEGFRPSPELVTGYQVSQFFIARRKRLKRIGIAFHTYGRRNYSNMRFCVTLPNGIVLFERRIDSGQLADSSFAVIEIGLDLKPGYPYAFSVFGNGRPGESVCVKWGPTRHANTERFYALDVNTNNNEMSCFIVYEDDAVVEPEPKAEIRVVPEAVVAAKAESDATPAAVPAPGSPVEDILAPRDPDGEASWDRTGGRKRKMKKENEVPGLVSIVIPCRNMPDTLGRALDSVYAQIYNNLDVVVVEDATIINERKGMADVVARFEPKGLKVVEGGFKGAPRARNAGEAVTDGEFLLFVDADSVLEPDCVAEMVAALHDNPSADWVYCDHRIGDTTVESREYDPKALLKLNMCPVTSMMRHHKFQSFTWALKRYQNWDMFLNLAKAGGFGKHIKKNLFWTDPARRGLTESMPDEEALKELAKLHPEVANV